MTSAVETAIRAVVTKGIESVSAYNREHRKAAAPNPFLEGVHKPMPEELTLTDLKVSGEIPAGLDGRFVRIGPNPVGAPNPATYHWFTGDGMVHGVRLQGGKALWYRNRWIRSTEVSEALGEAPKPGPRHLFDTVNTNVLGHAGSTYALVEAGGFPVRIDEELNTIAHDPFGGTLEGAYTAHPHTDPETGEMHAITYEGNAFNTVWHVVVDAKGKVRRREPIPVEHGPSIHDCMITKNYVIVLDLPVTFSMKRLLSGQSFPYAWNAKHKARVGLVPREGSGADTIWCDVDPAYVFHAANAYETADGKVIIDVCAHTSMFAESELGPDSKAVPFERWSVDPVARRVERTVVDSDDQEFPRPDERFIGKPYRYAFTVAMPKGGDEAFLKESRLYKHDLQTGTRQVHDFGEGRIPGEFVFVPRTADAPEGDG